MKVGDGKTSKDPPPPSPSPLHLTLYRIFPCFPSSLSLPLRPSPRLQIIPSRVTTSWWMQATALAASSL